MIRGKYRVLKNLQPRLVAILSCAVLAISWSGASWAIPMGSIGGSKIMVIDGDGDSDTSITLLSGSSSLVFGYYLNNSTAFSAFSGLDVFNDRDVLDLALQDGSTIYRASGDWIDPSYSLQMDFASDVSAGSYFSQEPLPLGVDTYYSSITTSWLLPSGNITSMNFALSGNGDGVTPVPEPASLFLMGAGLLGLSAFGRKRNKSKAT